MIVQDKTGLLRLTTASEFPAYLFESEEASYCKPLLEKRPIVINFSSICYAIQFLCTFFFIFFSLAAGAHKMFYLYVSENDAITNRTFCNEFSFSNTVINEELIECQTPMHGNKIILQRDGEIQLFEFRPFGKTFLLTKLKCFVMSVFAKRCM